MLNYWAAHDLTHTIQAERALMQPLIVNSGHWRTMYREHDVSADLGGEGGITIDA
jgi:hypothetical protein